MTSSCDDETGRCIELAARLLRHRPYHADPDLDAAIVAAAQRLRPLGEEVDRLRRVKEAARHYRFAGTPASLDYLKRRGWTGGERGLWYAPAGYPLHNSPASFTVALAVELELALGCHK